MLAKKVPVVPASSSSFTQIQNVPVHYDRPPLAPYGSIGVPYTFRCHADLIPALEALVGDVIAGSPAGFGALRYISSAGAYVDKSGQHGRGKAFDIDALHWEHVSLVADRQMEDTLLYLAIQALCHKHFGIVLGYNFNSDHHDHLHIDLTYQPRFRENKSTTYFLQETVNSIFGEAVDVDGEWGPQTAAAVRRVRDVLGIGGLSNKDHWIAFVSEISSAAFTRAEARRALIASMGMV